MDKLRAMKTFVQIADDGSLLVRTPEGVRPYASGEVVRLI